MATITSKIERWIENYIKSEEPRSKSLIISVFGDSIAPYTQGVWLGDLIEMMSAVGLNDRLVRTSTFRLIDEKWLVSERIGRKSFYSLTDSGTQRFEAAYQHIYKPPANDWDGKWTLIIIQRNSESTPERSELRRDLEWNGFALLANGVFIHPTASIETAAKIIERNGFEDLALPFRATTKLAGSSNLKIKECWDLDNVALRYQNFLDIFKKIASIIEDQSLSPKTAFQIQTLMIHSFRRANLNDPLLPNELLPQDWPGQQAFDLCRIIYAKTCQLSHKHVSEIASLESSIKAGTRLNIAVTNRFKS